MSLKKSSKTHNTRDFNNSNRKMNMSLSVARCSSIRPYLTSELKKLLSSNPQIMSSIRIRQKNINASKLSQSPTLTYIHRLMDALEDEKASSSTVRRQMS
jgi:hypothetical protein